MGIPNLKILDETLAELTGPLAFDAPPGARSNVVTLYLINNPGGTGAEPARDHVLRVLERDAGETVWHGAGRPIVDGRRVEVRVIAGTGGLEVDPTAWQPIGAGRSFELPEIPNDQGLQLEVSILLPLDAQGGQRELYFGIAGGGPEALGRGLTETAGDGINTGLGDGLATYLVHGGEVAAADPASDQVLVGEVGWLGAGEPFYLPPAAVTLDELDGDGVALAPGSAYFALLHLEASGSLGVVKNDQAPEPLPAELRPAVPASSVPLALVTRDESAQITDADLEPLTTPALAAFSSAALVATLGPSRGLVDSRWWRHDAPENGALPPSSSAEIWRLPGGDLAVTVAGDARPDPRALQLHQVETDAAAVITTQSQRRYLGQAEVIRFVFNEPLTGSPSALASWPFDTSGRLLPVPDQLVAQVLEVAGTAGASEFEIELLAEGETAWQTLFPSGLRPAVPFDARQATTIPEVLTIPPRALLRCRLVGETATAQPSGAVVSLTLWR